MNRRDFNSEAEYYRHHRKCFDLALELGCTPAEAEQELLREAARAKWHAQRRKLDAHTAASLPPIPQTPDYRRWDAPWMMRR